MTGEALPALSIVIVIIVTMMDMMIMMINIIIIIIASNQPKPLTGETLPALSQEISARLSLSYTGFVLAGKKLQLVSLVGGWGFSEIFLVPSQYQDKVGKGPE